MKKSLTILLFFAFTSIYGNEISELLNQHMWMQGAGAEHLFETIGPTILDNTNQYINNPRNRESLNTVEGKQLLQSQQRLHNYHQIKSVLKKCESDQSNDQLTARILTSAFETKEITITCNQRQYGPRAFNNVIAQLEDKIDIIDRMSRSERKKKSKMFLNKLLEKSYENAAKSYTSTRYQFEKDFAVNGKLNDSQLISAVNDFCSKGCLPKFKNKLKKIMQSEAALNLSLKKKFSNYSDVSDDINNKLGRLNTKLKNLEFEADQGWVKTKIWDSSDVKKNDLNQKKANEYIQSYIHEASSGPGILLLTDHMKKKAGGMRQLEDRDLIEHKNKKNTFFTFKRHQKSIQASDVEQAKNEILTKIKEQVGKLNKMGSSRGNRRSKKTENSIKSLLLTNPAAVGQVLLQDPSYSSLVCHEIKEIEQQQKSAKKREVWLWGGLMVGAAVGVVVLSGGTALAGALIGKGLILKSAGTAATAGLVKSLSTYTTVSLISGAVVGGIETAHLGHKTINTYKNMRDIESAYLSGNSDSHSITEAREALTEFKETRLKAAISLGFSVADLGALKSVASSARQTIASGPKMAKKSLSITELKNLTKTYKLFNGPHVGKLLAESGNLMGPTGGKNIDDFLLYLSKIDPSIRDKVFLKLSSAKWGPKRLKEVIESSLQKGRKASCG